MSNSSTLRFNRSQFFALAFVALFIVILVLMRIVIVPILAAALISFLLEPLLATLEKKGLSRGLSAAVLVGIGCIFVVVAVGLFIPLFIQQISDLAAQIPTLRQYSEDHLLPGILNWSGEFLGQNFAQRAAEELKGALSNSMLGGADLLISGITKSTQTIAYWIFEALITPLLVFFFIKNAEIGIAKVRTNTPHDLREKYGPVISEFSSTLRSVIKGQILTVSLLALLYSVSYTIVGMPYGFAIGLITGFVRLIPYMDIVIGGSLAAFVVFVKGGGDTNMMIAAAFCFAVIQVIDQFFLTPKILGKFSGIHPVIIVLAVLCFGDWFGFLGVLLAIPLAAIGKVAIAYLIREYQASAFFRNDNDVKNME